MGQKNEIAIEILYESYGKDNVEILDGNMARTPDGLVTLIAKLNPRQEIAAELYAIGMRQVEIEKLLKRCKDNPSSGYYSRLLKNPLVVNRRKEYAKEVADQATQKLTGVVVKAAENLRDAVQGGHLPSSLHVLKMADVINPVHKSQVEKKVSFGFWLSENQEKTIPVDLEVEEAIVVEKVAMSTDEVEDDFEGERLMLGDDNAER